MKNTIEKALQKQKQAKAATSDAKKVNEAPVHQETANSPMPSASSFCVFI